MLYPEIIKNCWATSTIIGIIGKKYISSFFPALLIQFDTSRYVTYLFGEHNFIFTNPFPTDSRVELTEARNTTGIPLQASNSSFSDFTTYLKTIQQPTSSSKTSRTTSFPVPREFFLLVGILGNTYYIEIIAKPQFVPFERYLPVFFLLGFDWIFLFGKNPKQGFKREQSLHRPQNVIQPKLQPQSFPNFKQQHLALQRSALTTNFLQTLVKQLKNDTDLSLVYSYERKYWVVNSISREEAVTYCQQLKKSKRYHWLLGTPLYLQGRVLLFEQNDNVLLLDIYDLIGREFVTHEL